MTVLALQYRPVRFADVVGQRHIKPILRSIVKKQEVPPALIFTGTRGTGKTTTVRILAAALNCEKPDSGDACGKCSSCKDIQSGMSLAFEEVDAASNGLVDDVRRIKEMVSYDVGVSWRVIALDEAHSMSRFAFNALLKVLEDAPERTTFVLLTTEIGRIPETVVSRSMVFDFRRMTVSDIIERLDHIAKDQGLKPSPELVAEVAIRAQGGMRDAVMMLDQCSRLDPPITGIDAFRELFGIQDVAVPVFTAALRGDHADGARLIDDYFHRAGDAQGLVNDLVALVRDLIILCSGGELPVSSEAALAQRVELAADVGVGVLVRVVTVLWELKDRTRAIDNDQRASMEMAFVLISNALHPVEVLSPALAQGPSEQPSEAPLTLEEMEEIVRTYKEVG